MSEIELTDSIPIKHPAHKEQHLCADKVYDAIDVREFLASASYAAHIKVNPRRSKGAESSGEPLQEEVSPENPHPARRWVVERAIAWLTKCRSLRTRWAKKAENWMALVQLACAHILLNLAVFG